MLPNFSFLRFDSQKNPNIVFAPLLYETVQKLDRTKVAIIFSDPFFEKPKYLGEAKGSRATKTLC
jgi:hypothetical protein